MRKIVIVLFVAGTFFNLSFAQESVNYRQDLANLLNQRANSGYNSNGEKSVYNQDFSKNPFIFEDWNYARVSFRDGKVVDSLLLNYDDEQKVLLVTLAKGNNPFSLDADDVKGFSFYDQSNQPFVGLKRTAFEDMDVALAYYQKVYENPEANGLILLKSHVKRFRDTEQEVSYAAVKSQGGKFDLHYRYYLKQGTKKYERVILGKKTIQGLIGKAKMKEAQTLIKSNKLKWGDERALVLVMEALL